MHLTYPLLLENFGEAFLRLLLLTTNWGLPDDFPALAVLLHDADAVGGNGLLLSEEVVTSGGGVRCGTWGKRGMDGAFVGREGRDDKVVEAHLRVVYTEAGASRDERPWVGIGDGGLFHVVQIATDGSSYDLHFHVVRHGRIDVTVGRCEHLPSVIMPAEGY